MRIPLIGNPPAIMVVMMVTALMLGGWRGRAAEATGEPAAQSASLTSGTGADEAGVQLKEESDEIYQAGSLPPLDVTAHRYHAGQNKLDLLRIKAFFDLQMDFGWPYLGAPAVLSPAHVPQRRKSVGYTVKVLERADLLNAAFSNSKDSLSVLPELGSVGRGRIAAEGGDEKIVLRGVDAGYGSTLIVRDGVPINDPVTGMAPLAALPRLGLFQAEVAPASGATAWGNGTTSGVIQFLTEPAKGQLVLEQGEPTDGGPPDPNLKKQAIRSTGQLAAVAGEEGTRGVNVITSQPNAYGVFQLIGQVFSSDGALVVAPEKAGSIDSAAWNHERLVEGRWRQPFKQKIELTATVRSYQESHGDGTPGQSGRSRATFASATLAGQRPGGLSWNALAYVQTGSADNHLTAINPARTAETPLLHEVTNPSTMTGASFAAVWRTDMESRMIAGADFRHLHGETESDFGFENEDFVRERAAGGDQDFAGVFLLRETTLFKKAKATFGARLDEWTESGGHIQEMNRATGLQESNEQFPDKNGLELSPSVGLVWPLGKNWLWKTSAQSSYRRPTLGERYETSGHHSVVIAPSPGLKTEHNTSMEVGIEYSIGRGSTTVGGRSVYDKLLPKFSLGATAFLNEIHDGIASVKADGAELPSMVLPAGYTLRKRVNTDRSRIQGLKLSADWHPSTTFSLNFSGLFNDAEIKSASVAPFLAQRQMAGVSRSTYTLGMTWHPEKRWRATARLRAFSEQFADSENTLRLGAATVLNLGVSYLWTEHTEFYFTADNITDARVETDRTADGVIYLGSPRLIVTGVRLKW